jgi:hypothetical protein
MTKAWNASYIIGLPLWRHDAIDDAREMISIAEKYIPSTHIVGYELGNEVRRGQWGSGRSGKGAGASDPAAKPGRSCCDGAPG